MKFLVALAFGAGIFLVTCNAACFSNDNKIKPGQKPKGCNYDGVMHPLNSKWRTKNCFDCWCLSNGNYKCCQAYGTPVNYDKKNCISVFDSKNCVYKVTRIDDPTTECEIYGMVG
ncbi:beta-microseminoprotein-like isoform X2 [Engystomops pustulosus]|uniref:beta-microseminoprotein-like isoform X2 n=1 Tax=Engystomops pustulosus TaxID=76066 RepID=UPI003AFA6DD6